jgi:peroxiredoxin
MKKSTIIKALMLCALLVSSGIFTLVVLGNRAPGRTESDSSKLDRLLADIGAAEHPFSTNTLAVKLQDTAGHHVGLGDYRGKVVFLSFWTTWCPSCITEMPAMEKLHRKLAGKNFAMVTVNIKESAFQVKTFFENYKLSFTALLDLTGEVSTEFGIRAIPTTFILDKKGNIIGRIAGPRNWDSKKAVALFEHLADN